MGCGNSFNGQEIKEQEINAPIVFKQPSESTPAKIIIVHISKIESFICSLNPAASLYEDVTEEEQITECFNNLRNYLKTKHIRLITVEEALLLKGKEDDLMKLAKESLNYERESKMETINETDDNSRSRKTSYDKYFLYSSDEYKESVIKKFSKKNLLNIILTRPQMKLKYSETDTYIEPTSITFSPLGNLVFCRDQQITTKKGVVIGRSRTSQRKYEHIIMKQVFKNLGINIIGEVNNGYLEGGDFFVSREDLSMIGLGIRTDAEGIKYLMENDLLGTRYMAVCFDETDLDQQRMHLDTYFNILNDKNALVIDFDEVSRQEKKNVNRRVYYFDNDKNSNAIKSDRDIIKNKIGEYKLIKIYDNFYKFLDDIGFNYIKITHEEQKQYMINFLNIGNNTVISVNKDLEEKVKNLGITVKYFNCRPILNMFGGMHCMTQVSRA